MARKLVLRVDFRCNRLDLVFRKAPRGFADRVGHFAEIEVEHRVRHGKSSQAPPLAERTVRWKLLQPMPKPTSGQVPVGLKLRMAYGKLAANLAMAGKRT